MENTIEYKGKEYTEEEIREIVIRVWNRIKEALEPIVKAVVNAVKYFASLLVTGKGIVGCKRLVKMDNLKEYEEMSAGRSNNWRKIHGLSLRRKFEQSNNL